MLQDLGRSLINALLGADYSNEPTRWDAAVRPVLATRRQSPAQRALDYDGYVRLNVAGANDGRTQ